MRHIRNLADAQLDQPSLVTIGAFDGVHRGHQYLVKELVREATSQEAVPVVLTFYPHPQMVLKGKEPGFYLTQPEEKAELLGQLGVELVVTHPFDTNVRQIRAVDFVDSLCHSLLMKGLWVGKDFAMGYQREGNVEFLRHQGQEKGFELRAVDLMDAGGERVSSSRVRHVLAGGDIEEAARLLGRPYQVTGEVVEGHKRGRTIGFPTANLAPHSEVALPAHGVYVAWAGVEGKKYPAVLNIGVRPTFDGESVTLVEAHLLDFQGDLYNKKITLEFLKRLRDEKKFESVDALIKQIHSDVQHALKWFASNHA